MTTPNDTPDVLKRLAAQEEQRRTQRDKKRLEEAGSRDPNESTTKFLGEFRERVKELEDGIERIQGDSQEVEEKCHDRMHELAELEDMVSKAAYYLPPFDVRQSRLTITDLRSKTEATRTRLAPKKKFTFTKKPKPGKRDPEKIAVTETEATPTPLRKDITQKSLEGKENAEVRIMEEELGGHGFSVKDCKNCTVLLQGTILSLHLRNLESCVVVVIGHVKGATMMFHVVDCHVYLASAQVRIHDSRRTVLNLRVRSHPIIEDSTQMTFGPLEPHRVEQSITIDDQQRLGDGSAALCEENCLWAAVNDFNWLKESPSPNWTTVESVTREEPK